LFYEGTKDILKPFFKPITKFLCIKGVIVLSFWQSLVVAGLEDFEILIVARPPDWGAGDVATALENFLLCVEMVPLAILFSKTFGYRSFKDPNASELLTDEPQTSHQRVQVAVGVVSNFLGDVMNVRDDMKEVASSMKKHASRTTLLDLERFITLPKKQQQKLVIYSGVLEKKKETIWRSDG